MHMQVSMAVNGSDVSILKFLHLKSFQTFVDFVQYLLQNFFFLSLFISRTQFFVNPCSTFLCLGGLFVKSL
jgi:hypothetical protein